MQESKQANEKGGAGNESRGYRSFATGQTCIGTCLHLSQAFARNMFHSMVSFGKPVNPVVRPGLGQLRGNNQSGGIFSKGKAAKVSQLAEAPLWPDQASRPHNTWTSHGIQMGRERRSEKKDMASSSSRPFEEFERA